MVRVLHEIAQPVLGIARIGRGARRWDETREAFRRREARIEQGDDETRLRRADPDFQGFDRQCGARLAGGDAQRWPDRAAPARAGPCDRRRPAL